MKNPISLRMLDSNGYKIVIQSNGLKVSCGALVVISGQKKQPIHSARVNSYWCHYDYRKDSKFPSRHDENQPDVVTIRRVTFSIDFDSTKHLHM